MENRKNILIISLLILVTLLLFSIQKEKGEINTAPTNEDVLISYEDIVLGCEENSGNWLEEYSECEYTNEDWCKTVKGTFMPCESACRHDSETEMCTMQCVPVCMFNPKKENSSSVTLEEARDLAMNGPCVKEGSLKEGGYYNPNSKTWWIDMDIEKDGCYPACVVSEETGDSEINWRCTGLIQ